MFDDGDDSIVMMSKEDQTERGSSMSICDSNDKSLLDLKRKMRFIVKTWGLPGIGYTELDGESDPIRTSFTGPIRFTYTKYVSSPDKENTSIPFQELLT